MADVHANKDRNPYGPGTLLPFVLGFVSLGVGGLVSLGTDQIWPILIGAVLAAVFFSIPFLTGRFRPADFRSSPSVNLPGSDDRWSSPESDRRFRYIVDGELRDTPPGPGEEAEAPGEYPIGRRAPSAAPRREREP